MGVTYETIDGVYPFVAAIYTCPCGKRAVRHAAEAGTPPPDWAAEYAAADPDRYVCPECLRRRAAGERPPQ